MNQKYKSLVNLLALGKLSNEEFLHQYLENKNPDPIHYLNLLKKGIFDKDLDIIGECLTIISIANFDKGVFLRNLCDLLQEDWHYSHEHIAMLLKEAKDPSTVNCLYQATVISFPYLEYDSTYQFARKCIKAMSAIGNDEALNKLNLLAENQNNNISDYAKKELKYHGRL